MSYFPMFIQLKGESCLVVGGGAVALRKVEVLQDFGAAVLVTAPAILPEIKSRNGVRWREGCFDPRDLKGQRLVVAATDRKEENHRISLLCRERGIPVNAVDQTEDCDFIFPSYLRSGEVVAAFSSGGQSPVVTQYLKERTSPVMTEVLGELAEQLGSLREQVKQAVDEKQRKAVYQALLQRGLEQGAVLSWEEAEQIITAMKGNLAVGLQKS